MQYYSFKQNKYDLEKLYKNQEIERKNVLEIKFKNVERHKKDLLF